MKEKSKSKFDEVGTYELFTQPFLFIGFHQKVFKIEVMLDRLWGHVVVRLFVRGEVHDYLVCEPATDSYMKLHDENHRTHAAVMIVRDATFANTAMHPDEPTKVYNWAFHNYPVEEIHLTQRAKLQQHFKCK